MLWVHLQTPHFPFLCIYFSQVSVLFPTLWCLCEFTWGVTGSVWYKTLTSFLFIYTSLQIYSFLVLEVQLNCFSPALNHLYIHCLNSDSLYILRHAGCAALEMVMSAVQWMDHFGLILTFCTDVHHPRRMNPHNNDLLTFPLVPQAGQFIQYFGIRCTYQTQIC